MNRAGDLHQRVVSIADCQVDRRLDQLLRELLASSFDDSFGAQRHAFEVPTRRLVIDRGSHLVAHLAAHEKILHGDGSAATFLGIAEVCVAPSHRGTGLVRTLLQTIERQYAHLDFAILLGDPAIYGSSGYRHVDNVVFPDDAAVACHSVQAKCLAATRWPRDTVYIHGPGF